MEDPPRDPAPSEGAESPTAEERNWAVLAHLGGVVTSFGCPLVIWLSRRKESPFLEDQAREALNFQISMLGVYFVSSILISVCIGLPLFALAFTANAVLSVAAAMGAREGRRHRYPFALRLIS